MKLSSIILLLLFSNLLFAGHPPLETVTNVNLDQYVGKWYEIARLPQRFQKDCTATTAEYSFRQDGEIRVVNSCRLKSPNGTLKTAEGRAWIKDTTTNAKLKVQFFLSRFKLPFLSGNYWILELGSDYEYAMIGDPSRKYFWILSRSRFMNDDLYSELLSKARKLGFNLEGLIKTIH